MNVFRFKLEKKGGKIVNKLNAENPIINGNKSHLVNVFNNLIENGIKYSKDKPVITIESRNDEPSMEISIKDNGVGLKYDNEELVKPYFTTKKTGSGLGLPIVTKIINEHDGSLSIKNNKIKKGTTLIISLPKYA